VEAIECCSPIHGRLVSIPFWQENDMFRFEKFDVWQRAVEFADHVYVSTRPFPDEERFGLTSQMRRAAVSVSSNIAEGSGRSSDKEFGRFVGIAYGSLMEVVSESHVARRQSFLAQDAFDKAYQDAEELARMLSGLKAKLGE
jgi:four helix bundle protein